MTDVCANCGKPKTAENTRPDPRWGIECICGAQLWLPASEVNQYWLAPAPNNKISLWNGYTPSEENLHYAEFCGIHQEGYPIWCYSRTDKPLGAMLIGEGTAMQIIAGFSSKERA